MQSLLIIKNILSFQVIVLSIDRYLVMIKLKLKQKTKKRVDHICASGCEIKVHTVKVDETISLL